MNRSRADRKTRLNFLKKMKKDLGVQRSSGDSLGSSKLWFARACSVTSVLSDFLGSYRLEPARVFQARILEQVAMPSCPGDLPDPGIEPTSPALWADSLLMEPPGTLLQE